jgi:hypothetical protein
MAEKKQEKPVTATLPKGTKVTAPPALLLRLHSGMRGWIGLSAPL